METLYGKIAPKSQQPERNHRMVFTCTKGFLKKQKWIVLDLDEYGMTYCSQPGMNAEMVSSIYERIEEIIINERTFILMIKTKDELSRFYEIDLKKFDGDLWQNFQKIKTVLTNFAGKIVFD